MRLPRLLSLSALFLGACVGHADVMLPHPLTQGGLSEAIEIEKPESLLESHNGLPLGALTQRAKLISVDDEQACFRVQLHSLNPEAVDLRQLKVELKEQPTGDKMAPTVTSGGRPAEKAYEGLVPFREQIGTETYCQRRDPNTNVCESWATRPTYTTRMVPGMVRVYESSSKLCFAHEGLISRKSERVILDLFKITMVGFMPQRMGVDFRWGFSGADKDDGKANTKQHASR